LHYADTFSQQPIEVDFHPPECTAFDGSLTRLFDIAYRNKRKQIPRVFSTLICLMPYANEIEELVLLCRRHGLK
jgi:hypothetical protein